MTQHPPRPSADDTWDETTEPGTDVAMVIDLTAEHLEDEETRVSSSPPPPAP
jgi:hypothetical protein